MKDVIKKPNRTWMDYLARHRTWAAIFLGGGAAIVVLIVAKMLQPTPKPTARYLYAARSIESGEPFSLRAVRSKYGDVKGEGPILTDQDLSECEGARFARTITMGEWIRREDLRWEDGALSKRIPKGHRAYPIRPGNFLALRSQDLVDIIWVPEREEASPSLLVEETLVLASKEKGDEVILALSEVEIELVEKALKQGKLNLALHRSDPATKRSGASRRRRDVFTPRTARRKIEIISGEGSAP